MVKFTGRITLAFVLTVKFNVKLNNKMDSKIY